MKHKLNRLTALLLAVIMAFSMLLVPVEAASFTDVSVKAWYKSAVDFVSEKGLMAGVSETRFAPETNMTRAMFVTVLARVAGVEVKKDTTVFSDVRTNQWYTGAVTWAAQQGLVSGVGGDRFAPNAEITRQDLCTILCKFLSKEDVELTLSKGKTFSDAQQIASYAKNAVNYCLQAGLISGYEDGTFRPKQTATRAEVAAILKKFYALSGGLPLRPARTLESGVGEALGVTVNAPEGALPENADLSVSRITDEVQLAELSAKVGSSVIAAADISFTRNGVELEPKTQVEVEIAVDGMESIEHPAVAHIRDDGTVEFVSSTVVSRNRSGSSKAVRFLADSFSIYVVIDGQQDSTEYLYFEFYARTKENGVAVAGPSADATKWEKINTQRVRKDGTGTGFEKQLYDPGVPTMSSTQLFEGWSVEKMNFTDADHAVTIGDLNKQITDGVYNSQENAVKVYAMVYEVVRVCYYNQSNQLIWSESVHKEIDSENASKRIAKVTPTQTVQPLVSSMTFLGWVDKSLVLKTGEMPEYAPNVTNEQVYLVGTEYVLDVTNATRLEFYPYMKAGHWLSFDSNVETNNKRLGFDDPTMASNVISQFVEDGKTPTQPDHPVRNGYRFEGWYKDPACNVKADFSQPLYAATTFYAKWEFAQTTFSLVVYRQDPDDAYFTNWTPFIDKDVYQLTTSVKTGTVLDATLVKLITDPSKNVTQLGDKVGSKFGYYFTYDDAHTTHGLRAYGDGSAFLRVCYTRRTISIGFFNHKTKALSTSWFTDPDTGNWVEGYSKYATYAGGEHPAVLWSSNPKYLDDSKYQFIPAANAQFVSNTITNEYGAIVMRTTPITVLQGLYESVLPQSDIPPVPKNELFGANTWASRAPQHGIDSLWDDDVHFNYSVTYPYKESQTVQNWSPYKLMIQGTKYQYYYLQKLPDYSVNEDDEEPRFSNSDFDDHDHNYDLNGRKLIGGAGVIKQAGFPDQVWENRTSASGNEFEGFRINHYDWDGKGSARSFTYYENPKSSDGKTYTITSDYDYRSNNGNPSNERQIWLMGPGDQNPEGAASLLKGTYFVKKQFNLYYERCRFTITFWDKDQAGTVLSRKLYYQRALNVLLDETEDPEASEKLVNPATHDGYFFDGWYEDPSFETPFDFDTFRGNGLMPADSVEVYSKWLPIRYRVLIDYTGGDANAWINYPDGKNQGATFVRDKDTLLSEGDFMVFSRRPDEDGYAYAFGGWYLDPEFKTPFSMTDRLNDDLIPEENVFDHYYGDKHYSESEYDYLNRMASGARMGTDPSDPYTIYDDRWYSNIGTTDHDAVARNNYNKSIRRIIRLYAKWNKELPGGDPVKVKYWGNHNVVDDQGAFDATGTGANRAHEWVDSDAYVIGAWTQGQAASVPVTPETEDDDSRRFLYWEHVNGDRESAFKPTAGKEKVYPGQPFQVLESDLCLVTTDNTDPYPYCKHLGSGATAVPHPREDPTCTDPGMEAYFTCSKCGRKYSDSQLSKPTVLIPALGHLWTDVDYVWSIDENAYWEKGVNEMPTCEAHAICDRCEAVAQEKAVVTANVTKEAAYQVEGNGYFSASFVNTSAFSDVTRAYRIPALEVVDVTYYYSDAKVVKDLGMTAGNVTLRNAALPEGFSVQAGYELVGWAETRVDPTTTAPAYTPVGGTKYISGNTTLYAVYRAKTADRGTKYVPVTGTETSGSFVITCGNSANLVALRSLYAAGKYGDADLGGAVPYAASGLYLGGSGSNTYLSNVGSGFVFTLSNGKLTAGGLELSTADSLSMAASGSNWTVSNTGVASGASKLAYTGGVFTTASDASGIYVWKASEQQDVTYTYSYAPNAGLSSFTVTCNSSTIGTAYEGSAIELPQPQALSDGKIFLGWIENAQPESATMPNVTVYRAGIKVTGNKTLVGLYRYVLDSCELASDVAVDDGNEYYITSGISGTVYILGSTNTPSQTTITNGRPTASSANKVVFTKMNGRVQVRNVSTGKYLNYNAGTYSFEYQDSASKTSGFKSLMNDGSDLYLLYSSYNGKYYYLYFDTNGPSLRYGLDVNIHAWRVVQGVRYASDNSAVIPQTAAHETSGFSDFAKNAGFSGNGVIQSDLYEELKEIGFDRFVNGERPESGFSGDTMGKKDAPAVRAPVNVNLAGDGTFVYKQVDAFSDYRDYLIVVVWGGKTYLLTHSPADESNAADLNAVEVTVNSDGTITGDYEDCVFKAWKEEYGFSLEGIEDDNLTGSYLFATDSHLRYFDIRYSNEEQDAPYWVYDSADHLLYSTRIDRTDNYFNLNYGTGTVALKNLNMASEVYLFEKQDATHSVTLYYWQTSEGGPAYDPEEVSVTFTVADGAKLNAARLDELELINNIGAPDEEFAQFTTYVKDLLRNGPPDVEFQDNVYKFSRWEMPNGETYIDGEVISNNYLLGDLEQNPNKDFGTWVPYTPSTIDPSLEYLVVLEGDHSKHQPDVMLLSYNPYGMYFGEGADIASSTTEYVTAYTAQADYDANGRIVGTKKDADGNPYNWTKDMTETSDWLDPSDKPSENDKILIQKVPDSIDYYAWTFSRPTGGEMVCRNYQAGNSKFCLEHLIYPNSYQLEWAALTLYEDDVSEWLYDAQQHSLSTNKRSLYLGFNTVINKNAELLALFNSTRYYGLCTWVEKENARATVRLFVREEQAPQNTVTITFHNGDQTETQVVYANQVTDLFPNRFVKEGYSFMAWNTDPNGNGTVYPDLDQVRISGNLDLYAQWQRIYTNGQKWEETSTIVPGKDYLIGLKVNNRVYLMVNKNEFSTQPYSYYDHDAEHEYEFGYLAPAVMDNNIVTGVDGEAAKDLYYCRWNFNGSDGLYMISSAVDSSRFLTLGGDPDVTYGAFPTTRGDYWKYSDKRLYVEFDDENQTKYYIAPVNALGGAWDTGSTNASNNAQAIPTRALTATDGPYAGTNTSGGCQIVIYQRSETSPGWDVRFVNTDGITLRESQYVQNGGTAILPNDPVQADYYFAGWFQKGATEYFDFDTPITNDLVLEARFVPQKETDYFVNLRAVYIQFDTEHTVIRWFGNNDGTGETGGDLYCSEKEDGIDPNTGAPTHSITFELDERTGIPVPTSNYNSTIPADIAHPIFDSGNADHPGSTTPSGLYYDDYEFVGWSLQPTGPGMTGEAHPELTEDDLTLKWIPAEVDSTTGEVTKPGHYAYYDKDQGQWVDGLVYNSDEGKWEDNLNVANDSSILNNAFYAVWRPKYYYVYHSATGDLERREIEYVDENGDPTNSYKEGSKPKPVNLVESTAPGTRYGGYYKTYGGVNTEYVDAAKKTGTFVGAWMTEEVALRNLIRALNDSNADMDALISALTPTQRKVLAETIGVPSGWNVENLEELTDAQIADLLGTLSTEDKASLIALTNEKGWIEAPAALKTDAVRSLIEALANSDGSEVDRLLSGITSADKEAIASVLDLGNVSDVTADTLNALTPEQIATLKALATDGVTAVWRTDTNVQIKDGLTSEFKDYDGYMKYQKEGSNTNIAYWTKKLAYSVAGITDERVAADINGETMRPVAGTVYYLKEVPEAYLASKLFFVYKNSSNAADDGDLSHVTFESLHMVMVLDDNYYSRYGYLIAQYDEGVVQEGEFFQGVFGKSFKIGNADGTSPVVTVNSGYYENLEVGQGYVAVVAWNEADMGRVFDSIPMWTTLDGVDVAADEWNKYVNMDDPLNTLSTTFELDLRNAMVNPDNEPWLGEGYGTKVRVSNGLEGDEEVVRWLDVKKEDDGRYLVRVPDLGMYFKKMQIVRYSEKYDDAFAGNDCLIYLADAVTDVFGIDYTEHTIENIVGTRTAWTTYTLDMANAVSHTASRPKTRAWLTEDYNKYYGTKVRVSNGDAENEIVCWLDVDENNGVYTVSVPDGMFCLMQLLRYKVENAKYFKGNKGNRNKAVGLTVEFAFSDDAEKTTLTNIHGYYRAYSGTKIEPVWQ